MVGSPVIRHAEHLAEDLLFIKEAESTDGRHRTIYPTPRYAICR